MKRKDYIFNMAGLIINRVKFHAPKCENGVDLDSVIAAGVDPTLPVFVFEKPLTRLMQKCFAQAKKAMAFNLVLPIFQKGGEKLGAIITQNEEVKKLNVNYKSGLEFNLQEQENFIKIDDLSPQKSLNNFFLDGYGNSGEIAFSTREFMLSGHNYVVELLNCSEKPKKVKFEMNINLEKGYYSFQKLSSGVLITNLLSFERKYFNYSSFANKLSFSCVDSLENSAFARIYICSEITLKPKQKKRLFFNFGSQKFVLRSKEGIDFFEELALRKNQEIFDIKIKAEDKKKEALINFVLPEKIYCAWLDDRSDKDSEIKYGCLKEKIVVRGKDGFIFQDLTGIRELKLYSGQEYKTIVVERGERLGNGSYMQIGTTKFFGKNSLTHKDLARKNTQILVC